MAEYKRKLDAGGGLREDPELTAMLRIAGLR
jgi:hypothetical protein